MIVKYWLKKKKPLKHCLIRTTWYLQALKAKLFKLLLIIPLSKQMMKLAIQFEVLLKLRNIDVAVLFTLDLDLKNHPEVQREEEDKAQRQLHERKEMAVPSEDFHHIGDVYVNGKELHYIF